MNIKFITGWTSSEDRIVSMNTIDLALCGQGKPEGNAAGLVPIQLASGVVVTPVVTVTSSTSTTKRNSRSAVIKVAIPYTALTKDAEGHTVADPTRSGADLSLHIVLALPASAVKDIKGTNGATSKQAAEAQVALLHYLLSALIGEQLGSLPSYMAAFGETDGNMVASIAPRPTIGGSGTARAIDTDVVGVLPANNIGGYAGAGFDLTGVKVQRDLNSVLGRIASGLPALSCADIPVYSGIRRSE